MAREPMLPVAEALRRVLESAAGPLESENVPLAQAHGRRLASGLAARRMQPPWPNSAMDGYAVRHSDLGALPATLTMVGSSAAGHAFEGAIGPGECVRIFTGAPVPDGADTIVIQEDTQADGERITMREIGPRGHYVRAAGLDFKAGDVLMEAGRKLGPAELALAAAMNHSAVPVVRKPRVAILATGDELVPPGVEPGRDQIVASNNFAVAAYVERAGGEPLDLGIAGDNFPAIEGAIRRARELRADVLVTLGGASVGDHDLVQSALANEGMDLGFWRIAMRPGKPLMHGRLGSDDQPMRILGLPGNPVSSIVCSLLFLVPLVEKLSGNRDSGGDLTTLAVLGADMGANDSREDYMRARITGWQDGKPVATAFTRQDSSMLGVLSQAQCLIVRAPFATPAKAGDPCRVVMI